MGVEDTDELKAFVRDYRELHNDHAECMAWVRAQMERQRKREEMWRKIATSTLGNLLWAVFIGLGLATWEFIKTRLK